MFCDIIIRNDESGFEKTHSYLLILVLSKTKIKLENGGILMAKNTKSVAETVRELAEPIAEEIGCWIWDVEYVKEGARRVLRITIDSEEGITIDDCEKMHRAIDPVLDEADPIEEAYYLEVSSPGVERELRTAEHLYACEGWNVEVKLYASLNGSKLYRGVLLEVGENGEIRIETKDGKNTNIMSFAPDTVAKVNTYFEF